MDELNPNPNLSQLSPNHTTACVFLSRRRLLSLAGIATASLASGCASRRYGHILAQDDKDMVGSHEAGAATWNPLVDESVAKLLGRCPPPSCTPIVPDPFAENQFHASTGLPGSSVPATTVSHTMSTDPMSQLNGPGQLGPGQLGPGQLGPAQLGPENLGQSGQFGAVPQGDVIVGSSQHQLATGPARVCFIGIENKSSEEMVDFKDQLYERIDSQLNSGESFRSISRRLVDAALIETRLRPDSLFLPQNRSAFAAALGRQGSPVDYLLYATITSGTTDRNKSTQRDYLLTLEMVNLQSGDYLKESSKIRKGYHKTRGGKWWNFGMFDQADG